MATSKPNRAQCRAASRAQWTAGFAVAAWLTAWLMAWPAVAFGDDARAPAIYKTHCVACHAAMTGGDGHVLYQRDDRLVRNRNDLRARVDFCRTSLGLSWSPTQIQAVSDYLNRQYYRFP